MSAIDVKQLLVPRFSNLLYPLQRSCKGAYWFHHVRSSVRPSMSYDKYTVILVLYTPVPHICPTYFLNQNITDRSDQKWKGPSSLHRYAADKISKHSEKHYSSYHGEERRIPFIFDDFHFCRSRVIELDMTENRSFTLCRMITWVVFVKFQNILTNTTQVIIQHRIKILFSIISSPITLEHKSYVVR
jgi:hypothetical protein